jgi:hypothetical protein
MLALLPGIGLACLLRLIAPPLREAAALDARRKPTLMRVDPRARTDGHACA